MITKNNGQISDIENLTSILIEYCEQHDTTEEIQRVLSLLYCIYNKVDELYIENH